MTNIIINNPILSFVVMTLLISCLPFFLAVKLNLDLFNSLNRMLLLILVVWSPNISAYIITYLKGNLSNFITTNFKLSRNITPWLVAFLPILIIGLYALVKGNLEDIEHLGIKSIALLFLSI